MPNKSERNLHKQNYETLMLSAHSYELLRIKKNGNSNFCIKEQSNSHHS
jgi:hypothetical protein